MVVVPMFISRITEYPFEGEFYRYIDESDLPLDEQTGGEELIWESPCDIIEASHTASSNFIEAKFVVYCPFDPQNESVEIRNGDRFYADFYGIQVNGRVVGVFPSQLGGITVYVQDLDA